MVINTNGVPHTHGFIKKDRSAVAYSKRMYAAHFIEQHNNGTVAWAEVVMAD
jgi:hypothetical protein